MRRIFVAVVILAAKASAAQQAPPEFYQFPTDSLENLFAGKTTQAGILSSTKFSHVAPNGNSVYLLPQDNMPCVVPSVTVGVMPNAYAPGSGNLGLIPNPGLQRIPLIPAPPARQSLKVTPTFKPLRKPLRLQP